MAGTKAAPKAKSGEGGERFRLKDPTTTFYDPETKLKVAADMEVGIPASGRGRLTLDAINAGGLIAVNTKSEKDSDAGDGK